MAATVSMAHMVDLALGTPEVGAVNFNVLHALLHAMLAKLNLSAATTELSKEDSDLLTVSDSGVGTISTESSEVKDGNGNDGTGSDIKSKSRSPYHELQRKVTKLEEQMEKLDQLPSNPDLFERTKPLGDGERPRPVSDMWQNVQLKNRVDANEEGIGKLMSLVEDLMSEMTKLKEDSTNLRQDLENHNIPGLRTDVEDLKKKLEDLDIQALRDFMAKLKKDLDELTNKMNDMTDLDELRKRLKDLENLTNTLNDRLNAYPPIEKFEDFVTWEGLEEALKGIRDDLEPKERVVIEMQTQTSRPTSAKNGPSEELKEMLERLGILGDKHEKLDGRVVKLEEEMPNKADKSDLDGLSTGPTGIPDDLVNQLKHLQDQLKALSKAREKLSELEEKLSHLPDLAGMEENIDGLNVGQGELQRLIEALRNEYETNISTLEDKISSLQELVMNEPEPEPVPPPRTPSPTVKLPPIPGASPPPDNSGKLRDLEKALSKKEADMKALQQKMKWLMQDTNKQVTDLKDRLKNVDTELQKLLSQRVTSPKKPPSPIRTKSNDMGRSLPPKSTSNANTSTTDMNQTISDSTQTQSPSPKTSPTVLQAKCPEPSPASVQSDVSVSSVFKIKPTVPSLPQIRPLSPTKPLPPILPAGSNAEKEASLYSNQIGSQILYPVGFHKENDIDIRPSKLAMNDGLEHNNDDKYFGMYDSSQGVEVGSQNTHDKFPNQTPNVGPAFGRNSEFEASENLHPINIDKHDSESVVLVHGTSEPIVPDPVTISNEPYQVQINSDLPNSESVMRVPSSPSQLSPLVPVSQGSVGDKVFGPNLASGTTQFHPKSKLSQNKESQSDENTIVSSTGTVENPHLDSYTSLTSPNKSNEKVRENPSRITTEISKFLSQTGPGDKKLSSGGVSAITFRTKSPINPNMTDSEALTRMQQIVLQLQAELDRLSQTAQRLIDDNNNKTKQIDNLVISNDKLERVKADKEYVQNEVDVKADKRLVENKVNRSLFDQTTDELNKLIKEMLDKLTGQEDAWKNALGTINEDVDGKLDRLEFGPIRDELERRLRALARQLKELALQDGNLEDDAAGIRKQLLRFHCISCDRPVDMTQQGPIPSIPAPGGLPATRSSRPYTTFELEQIRQHARSTLKKGLRNASNFERAILEKQMVRYRINQSGITFLSDSTNHGVLDYKPLESRENDAVCHDGIILQQPGIEVVDLYATARACGGGHTMTHPHRRITRVTQYNNLFRDEELAPATNEIHKPTVEELDIQGADGHIYKGRIDARLPSTLQQSAPNMTAPQPSNQTPKMSRVVYHQGSMPRPPLTAPASDRQPVSKLQRPTSARTIKPMPTSVPTADALEHQPTSPPNSTN